jgi:hypothetical protein
MKSAECRMRSGGVLVEALVDGGWKCLYCGGVVDVEQCPWCGAWKRKTVRLGDSETGRGGWKSRVMAAALVVLLLVAMSAAGAEVVLGWEPSQGWPVAGYNVYYGPAHRTYTNMIAVGPATTVTVSNLVAGATYYFAATAYDATGLESDYSVEVRCKLAPPPPVLMERHALVSAQVVFWGSTNLMDWERVATNEAWLVRPMTNGQWFFRAKVRSVGIQKGP